MIPAPATAMCSPQDTETMRKESSEGRASTNSLGGKRLLKMKAPPQLAPARALSPWTLSTSSPLLGPKDRLTGGPENKDGQEAARDRSTSQRYAAEHLRDHKNGSFLLLAWKVLY